MKATVKKEIERGIKLAIRAKALKSEIEELKKESSSILLPLLTAHDISKYEVEGLGKVYVKVSRGKTLNEDKLREQLLLAGIDLDQIESIIGASSHSWATEYVEVKSC